MPVPIFSDDARFLQALEEYASLCRIGDKPNREQFLARYADLADSLTDCLDGIEFVEQIAPQLRDAAHSSCEQPIANSQQPNPSEARTLKPELSTLGDFQILREVGRGGMGVVYEALQVSLDRRVALKVLPFAAMLSETQLTRFKNEARAAATLKHPYIVSIYSVGVERGVHYYAMELIDGPSLAEVIATMRHGREETEDREQATENPDVDSSTGQEPTANSQRPAHHALDTPSGQQPTANSQRLTANSQQPAHHALDTVAAALTTEFSTNPKQYFRRVASLGVQAAEALQHAHASGILHRDIKPANLLLDRSGKLYVTDFGLARIGTDASMTATGDLVGTLRYMSPEQVSGNPAGIDSRSDVYSLGVTLYEMASLRFAFANRDRESLLRQIAADEPPPLRKVCPRISSELETIIHKAMEKESADRYATAGDLAADLQRFLEGRSIQARWPSTLSRITKWGRRHVAAVMGVAALFAVSLVVLGIAFALVTSEQIKTSTALSEREAALDQAEANLEMAIETVDTMYMEFAQDWIANRAALSITQQVLLHRAADFYENLARMPARTTAERLRVLHALERRGLMALGLLDHPRAIEAFEKAIGVVRKLHADFPDQFEHRAALADVLLALSEACSETGRRREALAAIQEALAHAEALYEVSPNSAENILLLATCRGGLAELKVGRGEFADAYRLSSDAEKILAPLSQRGIEDPHASVARLSVAHVQSEALHGLGRLTEADEQSRRAREILRALKQVGGSDSRLWQGIEAELMEQQASLAAANNDLQGAIDLYTAVLDVRQQSFRVLQPPDITLLNWIFAEFELLVTEDSMFGLAGETDAFDDGHFAAYVQTQLRLAEVLRRAGRPYRAEQLLGEATFTMGMLVAGAPEDVRFRVTHANAWALAAAHVQESRPAEAEFLRKHAAALWQDTLAAFPDATDYRSGVHGHVDDLAWFREQFAGTLEQAKPGDGNAHGRPPSDTVFHLHANARVHFRTQRWKDCLLQFAKSAHHRQSHRAVDWLHLAMAYQHLGKTENAQALYDRAAAEIDASNDAPADVIELRDQAQQVLSPAEVTATSSASGIAEAEPD